MKPFFSSLCRVGYSLLLQGLQDLVAVPVLAHELGEDVELEPVDLRERGLLPDHGGDIIDECNIVFHIMLIVMNIK